eukprot:CAMPEP_0119363344 /NCGR_PEP_ID=MMETSP1334-20130426/10253_1 /TAXON_ID=127549 /ORGANISM="Calcidiscus leptoporus, Strain RCC1130" /LENGTH=124 /DNA_ID=CAMNT_0007378769 /DNA_START=58 /DNA_END=433 /DNA_ORIENTATION=-
MHRCAVMSRGGAARMVPAAPRPSCRAMIVPVAVHAPMTDADAVWCPPERHASCGEELSELSANVPVLAVRDRAETRFVAVVVQNVPVADLASASSTHASCAWSSMIAVLFPSRLVFCMISVRKF